MRSIHRVEHKVLAGPFARAFPDAEFYVTDKQYSFPLNLPKEFLEPSVFGLATGIILELG